MYHDRERVGVGGIQSKNETKQTKRNERNKQTKGTGLKSRFPRDPRFPRFGYNIFFPPFVLYCAEVFVSNTTTTLHFHSATELEIIAWHMGVICQPTPYTHFSHTLVKHVYIARESRFQSSTKGNKQNKQKETNKIKILIEKYYSAGYIIFFHPTTTLSCQKHFFLKQTFTVTHFRVR
jgi:hypothetical protein